MPKAELSENLAKILFAVKGVFSYADKWFDVQGEVKSHHGVR